MSVPRTTTPAAQPTHNRYLRKMLITIVKYTISWPFARFFPASPSCRANNDGGGPLSSSRSSTMFHPRLILHPTDYSPCARFAFEVAQDLASHHSARLLVVHVTDTLGPETISHGEALRQRQPAGHLERLREELHQVVPSRPGIAI